MAEFLYQGGDELAAHLKGVDFSPRPEGGYIVSSVPYEGAIVAPEVAWFARPAA